MRHLRRRRATAAGLAGAGLLFLLFALTGLGDVDHWREVEPLGVAGGAWAVVVLALAAGLGVQLWLNERRSLERERRLVESSAALHETTAELTEIAATDGLTGVANRRGFEARFGIELRRANRYGRPLSLVMLDLDHFKRTNDEYGHQFGDYVLREVAQVLRAHVRESDLVARVGGEEFVVLLAETSQADAAVVAGKLRAEVEAHRFDDGTHAVQLTVSAGVAGLDVLDTRDGGILVQSADQALYVAKREGRNRVGLAGTATAAVDALEG